MNNAEKLVGRILEREKELRALKFDIQAHFSAHWQEIIHSLSAQHDDTEALRTALDPDLTALAKRIRRAGVSRPRVASMIREVVRMGNVDPSRVSILADHCAKTYLERLKAINS